MEMKLYKLLSTMALGGLTFAFASCENADKSFPDYEGGTSVYFAEIIRHVLHPQNVLFP